MTLKHDAKLVAELAQGRWSLGRARELAERMVERPRELRALIAAIFRDEVELRKRASDVARRVTDLNAGLLWPYAEELAGLLAELAPGESRTRWHLGLVVARIAHTREQRFRAARLMHLLMEDESNVARCSAVEGIGLLATQEASLVAEAEEMIERALHGGTPAIKARARHARRRLEKAAKASTL